MKKLLSIAFCAALLAPASAAMALEEGVCRDVYINGDFAGQITFYFDHDAGRECFYEGEWYGPLNNISTQCNILEKKVKEGLSCLGNRTRDFTTVVRSDWYCDGFDYFGIPRWVEALYAGEAWGLGLQGFIKVEGLPLPLGFETT